MRRFYLYRRSGIYYAKLKTKSGVPLAGRSTKTGDRDEALLIVADWLKNGVPCGQQRKQKSVELAGDLTDIFKIVKKADIDSEAAMSIVSVLRERELIDFAITKHSYGKEKLIPFLQRFWDIVKSSYLKDKIAHGHRITLEYCKESMQKVNLHWKNHFGDIELRKISRKMLRDFSLTLCDKGLASSTINNIMVVGTSALKWAFTEGLIPCDPTEGLKTFTGNAKTRNIYTEEQIEAIFSVEWYDSRAKIASLLSLTTGLRSGEIRVLRRNSIKEDELEINWCWNDLEGLVPGTKNKTCRRVHLLPEIRAMLLGLIDSSPWKEHDNPFIFFSENPDKPCSGEHFRRHLIKVINIVNQPLGWKKTPSHSEDSILWMIKCKKDNKGNLIEEWSEPEAVSNIIEPNLNENDVKVEYLYLFSRRIYAAIGH